jgi:hypothetical protein
MRALAILLALLPSLAMAQATNLRITNASPSLTVPILNGSRPIIDNNGNIFVQCQLQPSLGICEGLSTTPSGSAPTLTFTRSGSGDLTVGTSTTLTWTTGNSPELCFASASPAAADWTGAKSVTGGSQAISFSTTGSKTLRLKCYSNTGASPERSVSINVVSSGSGPNPPPPTPGCAVTTSDPLFQPAGYTRVDRTWAQFWNGTAYPQGVTGEPWPVGAWTINNKSMSTAQSLTGKYISVPFVGNGQAYQFNWIQAKPVSSYGYQPARATDAMYVTISTCPGDFRLVGSFQYASPDPINDPTFIRQCRNLVISETSIFYGPQNISSAYCPVESGRTYYLNVIFANPLDGLSPSESGCRTAGYCETSWRHLVN